MNIFAYCPDPWQSALWLDDIRKNKMMTETCQILSTACNTLVPDHKYDLMRSFNPKHGSNIWTRASHGNFMWLCEYLQCLQDQRPYNADGTLHETIKQHYYTQFVGFAAEFRDRFPSQDLQTHSNNAAVGKPINVSFKHILNVYHAYRLYHTYRWRIDTISVTWNYGEEPNWWHQLNPEKFL